ncbi:MAG: hypothetical protein DDT19_00576 [Syntrophomonadaceae bacterium]|nr:hypothetical protein [Bacillota bacterium]
MAKIETPRDVLELFDLADRAITEARDDGGVAHRRYEVVLLGGAAVMLNFKGTRFTDDVDVIIPKAEGFNSARTDLKTSGVGSFFINKGLSLVSMTGVLLHPKWEERLITVKEYDNFTVKCLSAIDIAISKTARGHPNDFYDIYNSDITAHFPLEEFNALYKEGSALWSQSKAVSEKNRKEAEALILKRQLSTNNGQLFEERCKEILTGMARSGGISLTFSRDDFFRAPENRPPKEFLVFSYMLLSKSERLHALRLNPFVFKDIIPSVAFLLKTMGKSLADSSDTLTFGNLFKDYLKYSATLTSMMSHDIQSGGKGHKYTREDSRANKMFHVLASEFFAMIDLGKRLEINRAMSGQGMQR